MAAGAMLRFAGITGSGEVLADGAVVARKYDAAAGSLDATVSPGKGDIAVALVLRTSTGAAVGLSGPVFVEARQP